MSEQAGYCLALGGTNAREAVCYLNGDIDNFKVEPTPHETNLFFEWLAERIVGAASAGAEWTVIGVPGPAGEHDGHAFIGPMRNVQGLREQQYDLHQELVAHNPGIADILANGFTLLAVNDGDLAAHAVATRYAKDDDSITTVAALINGTGLGCGVVRRSKKDRTLFETLGLPFEIGHSPDGDDPLVTVEDTISGTAIKAIYDIEPEHMPADHAGWVRVGNGMGRMATQLALWAGVDLIVPTGGVGANASEKYKPALSRFMKAYAKQGNDTQKQFVPEIKFLPLDKQIADRFELYGAVGVAREHFAQAA